MRFNNPFHEGELRAQVKSNEEEIAQRNAGVISNTIPIGAIPFIAEQSLVVIGSVDHEGNPWASIMVGNPGFMQARDEGTVLIDTQQQLSAADDPLWTNIKTDAEVGLLVIDLSTRRRLRINGKIQRLGSTLLAVRVEQAYPNCPKYIQQRKLTLNDVTAHPPSQTTRRGVALDDEQQMLIANADTFFVASANPYHGVDASHRGGQPGFVRILEQQCIRIPDYTGNSLFNTLGNLMVYPHAGLVFVNFESNRVLQITGKTKILWDQQDPNNQTGGTGRYWQLNIKQWIETRLPHKLSWTVPDYSPYNPANQQRLSNVPIVMKLVIKKIFNKTQSIKAFHLETVDGSMLPTIEAGAHIPLKVILPDGKQVYRQYSILSDPTDRTHYEIAVLLESDGQGGSRYMHEVIGENHVIEAKLPRNDFPISNSARHHILIAGGIGITPILSMLKALMANKASLEVHYAAASESDLVYRDEIESLATGQASFYHPDKPDATRLDLEQLMSLPDKNTHIYVCGPERMITSVRNLADKYSWDSEQIHFETFGHHSMPDDKAVTVQLLRSQQTIVVKASQSILDAIIKTGIDVPHNCKRGECGMCVTTIIEGEPDHRDMFLSSSEHQHVMCLCVSRAKSEKLILDI